LFSFPDNLIDNMITSVIYSLISGSVHFRHNALHLRIRLCDAIGAKVNAREHERAYFVYLIENNLCENAQHDTQRARDDGLWGAAPVEEIVRVVAALHDGSVVQEVDGVEERIHGTQSDGVQQVKDAERCAGNEDVHEHVRRVQRVLHLAGRALKNRWQQTRRSLVNIIIL